MTSPDKPRKSTPRRSFRSGRGALIAISALLITSAGIRIFDGTGAAIARELDVVPSSDSEHSAQPVAMACQSDEGTQALLDALRAREVAVVEKELSLSERMKELEVAKAEIASDLDALTKAQARLEATMSRVSTAAEDDLSRLTAVYEAMKPKEAAALFEAMSPEFAAGFLGRMRPESAANVMVGLPPESAYSISVILAGRNANAPRE
ncbi:hypothetical protein [Celeribacter arenosi]|uniref:Magnesium transporter MgtE intracellular domain-containing protein n=1 Tax=Celeribacter arenosi TaxID=792649 RepID=A0ABP7JYX2_9RHOB